jgi:hypothetical protein
MGRWGGEVMEMLCYLGLFGCDGIDKSSFATRHWAMPSLFHVIEKVICFTSLGFAVIDKSSLAARHWATPSLLRIIEKVICFTARDGGLHFLGD